MKKLLLICLLSLCACGAGASNWYVPWTQASSGGTTYYSITPTADANGTISPSSVTSVASGGSQAFTMACNSGYQLASVTVDGSAATVYSPYTFSNVTATHTITFTCSLVVTSDLLTAIASVSSTYAAQAFRGTVYHYCDCGTGAASGCIAGNDTTGNGSDATPYRSISFPEYVAATTYSIGDKVHLASGNNKDYISLTNGNTGNWPASYIGTQWQYIVPARPSASAASLASTLTGLNTIAFCKGGVFINPQTGLYSNDFQPSGCTAGTTCLDVREYSSTQFTSTAAPQINTVGSGGAFSISGNYGGIRFMNLACNGGGTGATCFFFYGGVHDIEIGNMDINGFVIGIQNAGAQSGSTNTGLTLNGNRFVGNTAMAYLGGGNNTDISWNYFLNNGSSNDLDHTIYESAHVATTNNVVSHNYIEGAYGGTCYGNPIVMHGGFNYPVISYNVLKMDAAHTSAGCWGIGTGNGAYSEANFLRHGLFVGNTIINPGNMAAHFDACTDCLIADNLIISDWAYSGFKHGIMVPYDGPRAGVDDVSARNIITNNTIYFGANSTGGAQGFILPIGAGSVVSNNTVTFADTGSTGYALECFSYSGTEATYSFINNNHCSSGGAAYVWESTHGATLAAWRTYSGFDTNSITTAPNFVNPTSASGYNFKPNTGSPLISAGSHANAPTYDLTGVSTFGNPPDIGAYTH